MRLATLILLVAAGVMAATIPYPLVSSKKPAAAGGGSFVPSDVSGLVFWLNVDDLSGSDGDAIQTFPDYTANNHDFSHATAGNRPLLTNSTSVMNNKKTLWFDGAADQLTNKTFALTAQNYTFYGVIKFKEGYNNFADGYLLDDTSGTTEFSIRPEDAGFHKLTVYDGTTARQFSAIPDTSARVLSIVMNSTGTALQAYTNGIAAGAATAWNQPGGNYLTLGALQGGGSYFNGIIADILLYSGAHGTTDRQNIEDYLGTKFGITIAH